MQLIGQRRTAGCPTAPPQTCTERSRGIPACSIHTSPPSRPGFRVPHRAVDSLRSPLRGACGVVSPIRSGSMPLNMSSPAPVHLRFSGLQNAKYIISKSRGSGYYLTESSAVGDTIAPSAKMGRGQGWGFILYTISIRKVLRMPFILISYL